MRLIDFFPRPPNWVTTDDRVLEWDIQYKTHEYNFVINVLRGSVCLKSLQRIVRVENPFLYARYSLKKAEYCFTRQFHEL